MMGPLRGRLKSSYSDTEDDGVGVWYAVAHSSQHKHKYVGWSGVGG